MGNYVAITKEDFDKLKQSSNRTVDEQFLSECFDAGRFLPSVAAVAARLGIPYKNFLHIMEKDDRIAIAIGQGRASTIYNTNERLYNVANMADERLTAGAAKVLFDNMSEEGITKADYEALKQELEAMEAARMQREIQHMKEVATLRHGEGTLEATRSKRLAMIEALGGENE